MALVNRLLSFRHAKGLANLFQTAVGNGDAALYRRAWRGDLPRRNFDE